MGNPLGVFDDDELQGLTEDEKEQLRRAIILVLRDQNVLREFLVAHPDIRNKLRNEVKNTYLHGSKLNLKSR